MAIQEQLRNYGSPSITAPWPLKGGYAMDCLRVILITVWDVCLRVGDLWVTHSGAEWILPLPAHLPETQLLVSGRRSPSNGKE